ncbi:hypothetical protein [Nakamurella endophytica]|uniref:Uncharacterized protein n=1 Tax=Nakamurella endophytica TaxID=1748367 RepID=A0A917T3S7_9ACTN|nr:hypothetical protein [Nakamurella endophytica]GGM09247.1 hypothetical protein GCM10011594_31450 [Nakamurella endophytica]
MSKPGVDDGGDYGTWPLPIQPLFQHMLLASVSSDHNLVEVLGLAAARKIAFDLAKEPNMVLSAADIRGLHAQICVGEWFAGSYKTFPNAIEGSEHTTSLPIDTSHHMSQLVDWMALIPDLITSMLQQKLGRAFKTWS